MPVFDHASCFYGVLEDCAANDVGERGEDDGTGNLGGNCEDWRSGVSFAVCDEDGGQGGCVEDVVDIVLLQCFGG